MYGDIAIAASAAWLALLMLCAMRSRSPRRRRLRAHGRRRSPGLARWPAGDYGGARPALVNLAVHQCGVTEAAYAATILDLAARGYLRGSVGDQGRLWVDQQADPAATPPLAAYERQVLAVVSGRIADYGAAPFEALADTCSADPRGVWDPFEASVRQEARLAGLTSSRIPAAARLVLHVSGLAVTGLIFQAVHSRPHSGLGLPLLVGFFALIVPQGWVWQLASEDRLTVTGSALADQWTKADLTALVPAAGEPDFGSAAGPGLLRPDILAFAVAASRVRTVPGRTACDSGGGRPGRRQASARRPDQSRRPETVWSSFGGNWRQVPIDSADPPSHPLILLAVAAWIGLLSCGAWLLPGLYGVVLPLVLLTGAVTAGTYGIRGYARRLARPKAVEFDGQVIARWLEQRSSGDDNVDVHCLAIDDGQRAWSFDADGPAGRAKLGDLVRVRADPRRMRITGLTIMSSWPAAAESAPQIPAPP